VGGDVAVIEERLTSTDRWTCPHPLCGDTLVQSSLTTKEQWEQQLRAMQLQHGRKHGTIAPARARR
jgi:hypothetical protein